MTIAYFSYGSTLGGMVNVETVIPQPPHTLPAFGGAPIPTMGQVGRRLLSGRLKRSGRQNGAWMWDLLLNGQSDLLALQRALMGDLTTASRELYVTTLDSDGYWSPFLVHIDAPFAGQSKEITYGGQPIAARFDLVGGVLQSLTKTGNYTVTTADHLIYCDTTSGNITLSLAAISGFNADVPYRFVKTAAGNTLTLDPDGSETINGSSTLAVTTLNASTTIIKSGGQWVTI